MTDRPYTDDDLRSAAALLHYAMAIGTSPADVDTVLSGHAAWANVELGSAEEDRLRTSVVELAATAADVSEWAVNLGADGLQPYDGSLTLSADTDKPIVRVHVAFDPDMPDEMRVAFLEGLGQQIASFL